MTNFGESREALAPENTRGGDSPVKTPEANSVTTQARILFLKSLSHELRSPLAAIVGYAELLGRQSAGDKEKVDAIRRNSKALVELLDDFLDLAKLDAGQFELQSAAFDPAQLVKEVVTYFEPAAREKSLLLSTELQQPIPTSVQADRKQLRRVLTHLIGNAIRFTDHGSIKISLRSISHAKQICFEVVDTGIGFRPDVLPKLFDSPERGGTNIRLALGQRLAHAMGGEIVVRNGARGGSVVTCSVSVTTSKGAGESPRRDELADPPLPEKPAVQSGKESFAPPITRWQILVVDDRRDIRRIMRHFVEAIGCEVTFAENGRQALDVISRQTANGPPLDLVFMDVQMPDLDGLETTRQLRAAGCSIPIVALTGNASDQDRAECLAAGFTDFLVKPIQPADLDRILATHLEPRES